MKLPAVLAVPIGIFILACSSAAPVPTPDATPNIPATVDALVNQRLAERSATTSERDPGSTVEQESIVPPTETPKDPTPDINATVEARLSQATETTKDPTPDINATVEARLAQEGPVDPTVAVAPTLHESDPYLVVQQSTVKISYLTANGGYFGSGVIVGDGYFVVTNAHVVSSATGNVQVAHHQESGPSVVSDGSIIYVDEVYDLALIRIMDLLGPPVKASFGVPDLGEELIIGGFPAMGGETLTATRGSVAGFEFDGLLIKFDGEIGKGNSGGPALNKKGQLVGIVTYGVSDETAGNLGMMFSTRTFSGGLANELLKYNETPSGNGERYELNIIDISAYVTNPSGWRIQAGLNYFHTEAPGSSTYSEGLLTDDYKVVGIFKANSFSGESTEMVLDRLVTELGESFQPTPEHTIPTPLGFDECELLKTIKDYRETPFTRRGYVWSGGWFSHTGLYTGFCVGISNGQKLIAFAESPDINDIVHNNGLFSKIVLGTVDTR